MAAAPQTQTQSVPMPLPQQQPVPSGSSGTGGANGYHPNPQPYQNAQPPLYHYSTPPLYQNHGYSNTPSSSSSSSSGATAQPFAPPQQQQQQYFPPGQHLGPPQQQLYPHSSPSAPMTAVATHYQPPPFDLVGVQVQSQPMQGSVLSEEGWEDVGPGKLANNERYYSGGRQRTPVEAVRIFEQQYQICSKPSKEIRASLAQQSGLPLRTVQIWFQNRRAKDVLEAKRAVMAQAAVASAAAVAAGLPPPPAPAFPPSRRQMLRTPSSKTSAGNPDNARTPSNSKSNPASGSASASSSSTTPDVAAAALPDTAQAHLNGHASLAEAGPSSAPPVMAPNNQIMYPQFINPNPAFYGYAYPSVGAAAVGGPLASPARMGRRSSIANGEAANISTIVQRQQRGSIGAANAARRGSIPYPPSIHSTLLAANANANPNASVNALPPSPHHQAHRNGGHTVNGGLMSSPLSPQGSASHLAKTALRNNSRRASMPGNGGLFALTQGQQANGMPTPTPTRTANAGLGISTTTVSAQAFTPPRTVSGAGPAAPLPSDGRVTRELPPSTSQSDQAQAKAALLPQMPGSAGQDMSNEFDPSVHTPTRPSANQNGGNAMFPLPSDSFAQPLPLFDPLQSNGNGNAVGPLPNPTFVFGNSQPQAPGQANGMINYGIDETYLSMQNRSRLNSLASIGTYASEVPTELSSEFGGNGTFDYLPVPESFDLYSRRASAPADLIDGMGLVGLNQMSASANPSNQPIRPSPLGQTHSMSSDHLRTQAQAHVQGLGPYQYGYNIGLGLPPNNGNANGHAMMSVPSQSQHSGSTSPADYPQPTAQWSTALTYAPLVSRETSNSTDNIYTPTSFFPAPSADPTTTRHTEASLGLDLSSFDVQEWANLGNNLPSTTSASAPAPLGFTLPHLNSSDFLASLNYADQVVPEEDEEEKDGIGLAFQPDQIDNLVLQQ